MSACGGLAYFDLVIVALKRILIVGILRRQVWEDKNKGAIIIPHSPFQAQDGGCRKLIEVTVSSNEKFYIFSFGKQLSDQLFQPALGPIKSSSCLWPKKLTV